MRKSGIANLPLHPGRAPAWLFKRMVKLSREISTIIVDEYGQKEFLNRIADPYFFQSFSCVIGFDWHSSGVTTTTCGALKMSLTMQEHGLAVCGGKGKTSRKTPDEIRSLELKNTKDLVYASRMSAKVDNSLIQDDYQLYHHCFFVTERGQWAVVQQGKHNYSTYARRYHWISDKINSFVEEPQNAICCDEKKDKVLDMTAKKSKEIRKISVDLVNDNCFARQRTLTEYQKPYSVLTMKPEHPVYLRDLHKTSVESLRKAYEIQPKNYEELVSLKGVGPKTIRALALISELVYGEKASWRDPAKYSFTVGGKDGYPYPINKAHYDGVISCLKDSIQQARLGDKDRKYAIKRLKDFI